MAHGVCPNLVRVSVGLEDLEVCILLICVIINV